MKFRKDLNPGARLGSGEKLQHPPSARTAAVSAGISLKQALRTIVSPALRLHHYRSAHSRLLQHAWCKLDSPAYRECRVDE